MSEGLRDIIAFKLKRSMLCPSCQEGKMHIVKGLWKCEKCDYLISVKELNDNYVFWFCDECNVFLNNQEGFDICSDTHICTNCGYENNISNSNIKGVCSDCGAIINNLEDTLCEECRIKRKDVAKKRLSTIGWIAGATFFIAGATYGVTKISPNTIDTVATTIKSATPKVKKAMEKGTKVVSDFIPKVSSSVEKPIEKVLYTTNEWKGYGKQNYYKNQYKLIGDKIVKYKLNRFKSFDGHESEWVHTAKEVASYAIDELDIAGLDWLKKFL